MSIKVNDFEEVFELFDSYIIESNKFQNDITIRISRYNALQKMNIGSEMGLNEFDAAITRFKTDLLIWIEKYKNEFPLLAKANYQSVNIDFSEDIFNALLKLNYDREYEQLGNFIRTKRNRALILSGFNPKHYLGFLKMVSIFNQVKVNDQKIRIFSRSKYDFDSTIEEQYFKDILNTWENDKSVLIVWNLKNVPSRKAEEKLTEFWQRVLAACNKIHSDNYLIFLVIAESIEGECPSCFKEELSPSEIDSNNFIYSILPDVFSKEIHLEPWLKEISRDLIGIFKPPTVEYFDDYNGDPGAIIYHFCEYAQRELQCQEKLHHRLIQENFKNWNPYYE